MAAAATAPSVLRGGAGGGASAAVAPSMRCSCSTGAGGGSFASSEAGYSCYDVDSRAPSSRVRGFSSSARSSSSSRVMGAAGTRFGPVSRAMRRSSRLQVQKLGLKGLSPSLTPLSARAGFGVISTSGTICSLENGGQVELTHQVLDIGFKVPQLEPADEHEAVLQSATGSGISLIRSHTQADFKAETWSDVNVCYGARANGTIFFGEEWYRRLLVAMPGFVGLNLSGPQSVLEAVGVLAAIITVHEAGHFTAARLQNIHVTKFAIGFGPTLAKYQQQGVEYSLRAFPFGGFVAFPDDDPNSEFSPDDPNLLKNRPLLDRALVISAGVVANIVFAYSVLFVQTFGVGLLEREMFPGVLVPEVISKSAAAKAGMQVGDVVLAVDGYQFSAKDSAVFELVDSIKSSPGKPITLVVQRGEDVVAVKVTPDENRDGSGRIGVQLSPNAKQHRVKAENLLDATVKSGREFGRLTATVLDGLKQIFFNFSKTVDSVSGPVAIVAVGAEVARSDISGLYQFAAIVNINLAIVNLLPLPALDGGYLAFVLLEALRGGKKLPDGVEQGIMSSGVLLLLALGVVLMVRDTLNLGFVQQML